MSSLPVLYPSETIYSWLTRAFLLSGYANPKEFYLRALSTARVRLHPYLNNRINQLAAQSEYKAIQLLYQHTLFPLFHTFALKKNQEKLKEKLLSNEMLAISVAGIIQCNFPVFHGHKYCPLCVAEDIESYGCGYWHIQHQIPAVCSCYKHGALLLSIKSGETNLDRKLILPPKNEKSEASTQIDIIFAQFSAGILHHLQMGESLEHYQSLYSQQLSDKHLLTKAGQLRYKKTLAELHQFFQKVTTYSSNELSIPDELLSFKFIGRLYRTRDHHSSHPLKHLLFSCWLLDGDPDCLFNPRQESETYSNEFSINDGKDDVIIEMLQNGDSYNHIYQQTGRSRCYIKRLASLNKTDCQSNHKKINEIMVRKILMKALLGQHRLSISQLFDISLGSVEQIISSEPALVAWRKYLRYQNKKWPYIAEITSYIKKNPKCMRKDVKEDCNAAFFWCFLHEKEWLNSILPAPLKPIRHNYCNWQERDDKTEKKIAEILLNSASVISITKLDSLVGGKKWLTRFIEKLPNSRKIIAKAIIEKKVISKNLNKYLS